MKISIVRHPDMSRGALISECKRYRYTLDRVWNGRLASCTFIMLNPSVADANIDDPTIRRCIAFAQREDCGAIRVVNLFAFRATSPQKMKAAANPVGPRNDEILDAVLRRAAQDASPVVAAWGVHGSHFERDQVVAALAARYGVTLQCLGKTKDGAPKHPLYVPSEQPLEPWP